MRKPSILSNAKECYISGRTDNLECHHIYGGRKNRKISDENGFWVWLTADWHRHNKGSIEKNPGAGIDKMLKEACQTAYEKEHSREEFRKLIGKSYL